MLPVRSRLRTKNVDCDEECIFCDQELETVLHLFIQCPYTVEAWKFTPIRDFILSRTTKNFWELFTQAVDRLETGELQFFVAMCWTVWTTRNDGYWRDIHTRPEHVFYTAARQLAEYFDATEAENTLNDSNVQQPGQALNWTPPTMGCFKMNIDAAVFAEIKMSGAGAIIRDEEGEVLGSLSCPIPGERSPLEAEAMALLYSLQWLRDLSIHGVIVAMDCLQVVQAFNSPSITWATELGIVLDECKQMLQPPICLGITHTRREGNKAAHCLAKLAEANTREATWMKEFPTCITHIIEAEKPV